MRQSVLPTYLLSLLFLLTGLVAGLNLPDLDLRVGFLGHRSIITHNALFPFFLLLGVYRKEPPTTRWLAIGFSLALATHLCFDLFPKAWSGFALITIPFYGRSNPFFSWLWIALSIICCLYWALLLVKKVWDLLAVIGGGVVSFGYCATTEPGVWPALIALLLGTVLVLLLPSSATDLLKKQRRKLRASSRGKP